MGNTCFPKQSVNKIIEKEDKRGELFLGGITAAENIKFL